MANKFSLLFSAGFILSNVICVFGQVEEPNAAEVLRHYKESLSWLQSASMKVDVIMPLDPNKVGAGFSRNEAHFVHRRDDSRCEWLGEGMAFDAQGEIVIESHSLIKSIFTGNQYIEVLGPPEGYGRLPFGAFIHSSDFEDRRKSLYDSPRLAGPLNGNIFGNNHKSVAELLSDANDLTLRSGMETVSDISCYVLDGTTNYGRVTAWVAPGKGYNALKWVIEKNPNNLYNKTRLSVKSPKTKYWIATLDLVEVQNLDAVFVISGGCFAHTVVEHNGKTTGSYYKYKRTEIELNPDFEAIETFKLNLPDSTRVYIKKCPGVRYKWRDGKIVPDVDAPTFEEIDKMVEELKNESPADSNSED